MAVNDLAGLMQIVRHRLLKLLGQELTKILSKHKEIMAWEFDIAPRTMSHIIKHDLGLSNDKEDNVLPLH